MEAQASGGIVEREGIGAQFVLGQQNTQEQLSADEARQQLEQAQARLTALAELNRVRARAGELGVILQTGEYMPSPSGTYISADEFQIDTDTNNVEAIGNVVVTTKGEDGSTITMRTNHLVIE